MKDRPDEPGIWTREGKFYRVWENPGSPEFFGDEILPNGTLGDYLDFSTMPGNWHKLTAPATNAEARDKFHGWLKGHRSQSYDEQIADKAAEIFAGVEYVPIEKYRIAVKQIEDLETQVHQIAGLKGIIARQDEEITSLRLANIAEREQPPEPGVIDQLYRHAIDRVDRVFQECTENPKPILPDFLRLGEDKFDGVVKLAEAYREAQNQITTLKATVARLEEQVATEHAKYINSERTATVALQAQTIIRQADEIAELKRERNNFENGCECLAEDVKKLSFQLNEAKNSAAAWESTASFAAEKIAEMRKPPTVIEGNVQADRAGIYAYEQDGEVHASTWKVGEFFYKTRRYIYIAPLPTFPPKPKPAFVAPPKPEQFLYRWRRLNGTEEAFWTTKRREGHYIGVLDGCTYTSGEVIDPTTGEPIKEQA